MTDERANPVWDYACDLYGRPGVAEACLSLQDRRGLDVNLLLFCCWAGHCGRVLSADEVARLCDGVAEWNQDVIQPLRALRRWLKDQAIAPRGEAEALRQSIKASELEAERLEQDILHRLLPLVPGAAGASAEAAADSLVNYLFHLGTAPDEIDSAALATVLDAAFGAALSPVHAMWRLQRQVR